MFCSSCMPPKQDKLLSKWERSCRKSSLMRIPPALSANTYLAGTPEGSENPAFPADAETSALEGMRPKAPDTGWGGGQLEQDRRLRCESPLTHPSEGAPGTFSQALSLPSAPGPSPSALPSPEKHGSPPLGQAFRVKAAFLTLTSNPSPALSSWSPT